MSGVPVERFRNVQTDKRAHRSIEETVRHARAHALDMRAASILTASTYGSTPQGVGLKTNLCVISRAISRDPCFAHDRKCYHCRASIQNDVITSHRFTGADMRPSVHDRCSPRNE